jgi:hypothetical protein
MDDGNTYAAFHLVNLRRNKRSWFYTSSINHLNKQIEWVRMTNIWIIVPCNIEPVTYPAKFTFSEEYNLDEICGALGSLDQGADMAQMCTGGGWNFSGVNRDTE